LRNRLEIARISKYTTGENLPLPYRAPPPTHTNEVDAPTGKLPPLTSSDDIRKHCYYPVILVYGVSKTT